MTAGFASGKEADMTLGLAYWILMLIWLVFGLLTHFGYAGAYGNVGNVVLLFVLFVLLGWQVFGAPLHK
jgi:uncharacterized membrane protein